MEYQIVTGSEKIVQAVVRNLIKDGWVPLGGVSVSQGPEVFSSALFAQALTKS